MTTQSTLNLESLIERYRRVRRFSDLLTEPLTAEDCMVQSMPDVSPTRWHLAHTTWFFETFVLSPEDGYQCFDDQYGHLFNSYYNTIGSQFPRPRRGLISRPGLARIMEYRAYVDDQMDNLLSSGNLNDNARHVIEVGLQHEQQHQELMLTDIKHVLSCNPTLPAYDQRPLAPSSAADRSWHEYPAGTYQFGHATNEFCFDNELPRHTSYLQEFSLASHVVTCGDFIDFIEDDGYTTPNHWLSLGWTTVLNNQWDAPLYWVKQDGQWMYFTLAGLIPIHSDRPVCHVSYFEADAYARWCSSRLPTEFEWERAAARLPIQGQFADGLMAKERAIHPTESRLFFGGVWEWTSSSYAPYPGYRPPAGALGEYNGKFMCNQYVLRGGSVATSRAHLRPTYRNFFPPDARWQFSGIRLAR
jgi:ergothioneine biosynthesis protein EgtB